MKGEQFSLSVFVFSYSFKVNPSFSISSSGTVCVYKCCEQNVTHTNLWISPKGFVVNQDSFVSLRPRFDPWLSHIVIATYCTQENLASVDLNGNICCKPGFSQYGVQVDYPGQVWMC